MNAKVLFVDDEPNILEGIRRQLRKKIAIETATSGREGLQIVRDRGPFAMVVSDMRMPEMNGAEFLAEVRAINPDSVRIILSGQAELESTIAAVNQGNIFRFLTKPCAAEDLISTLEAGLKQYRLINTERELLGKTLNGAIKTLTEILGLLNPGAFSRASRIRQYAEDIGASVCISNDWQFKLATMLSQIGCIILPGEVLAKISTGQVLSEEEQSLYESHPQVAGMLLASIPRLEGVAYMLSRQMEHIDKTTLPADIAQWDKKTLGAEIIRLATELDNLIVSGVDHTAALEKVGKQSINLPVPLKQALRLVKVVKERTVEKLIKASQFEVGMVLDEDVMTPNGTLILTRGQEITRTLLIRIAGISKGVGIVEPIRVKVAQHQSPSEGTQV